jgi:acetyl esterase
LRSKAVDRLMQAMRDANGTPLEPVRNALVAAAGRSFDVAYGYQEWRSKTEVIHPLSHLIASQVGDPFERWDFSDIPAFREHYEEMLDYLPRKVLCDTQDRVIKYDGLELKARVFTPRITRQDLTVVFLHGGGFVLGDFDSNDPECDKMARGAGCQVISLGYPLSPESKFPSALDSVCYVLSESDLVAAKSSLVLAGESAGANLTLAAVQTDSRLRERCLGLVMAYPFLDLTLSGETVEEYANGYFLTRRLLEWFVSCYLGPESHPKDARISPLFGKIKDVPRSFVLVGEYDPLRSDAIRFADSNEQVELAVFAGMIHGFLQLRGLLPARDRALDMIIQFVSSL